MDCGNSRITCRLCCSMLSLYWSWRPLRSFSVAQTHSLVCYRNNKDGHDTKNVDGRRELLVEECECLQHQLRRTTDSDDGIGLLGTATARSRCRAAVYTGGFCSLFWRRQTVQKLRSKKVDASAFFAALLVCVGAQVSLTNRCRSCQR